MRHCTHISRVHACGLACFRYCLQEWESRRLFVSRKYGLYSECSFVYLVFKAELSYTLSDELDANAATFAHHPNITIFCQICILKFFNILYIYIIIYIIIYIGVFFGNIPTGSQLFYFTKSLIIEEAVDNMPFSAFSTSL